MRLTTEEPGGNSCEPGTAALLDGMPGEIVRAVHTEQLREKRVRAIMREPCCVYYLMLEFVGAVRSGWPHS